MPTRSCERALLVRIDVLAGTDGVRFDQCCANALDVELADTSVPVIALSDLKVDERASGGPNGLADLDPSPVMPQRLRELR
jgi:hypothetical protein